MELWAWAILLLVIGLALAVVEVFVPSGGLIGFLAFAAIVGAVLVAFMENSLTGLAILAISILGLPVVIALGLKWWPHTPIGKRVLLDAPDSDEVLPDDPKRRALKSLVGKVGRAKSRMLPSGPVMIEGRTIDAVSEGLPIEPDQPVQVVAVHGTEVIVRPVDEQTLHAANPPADDLLAQPIESVLPDPFEEPPA
jgi:membrane-bound ClpP family serine protease